MSGEESQNALAAMVRNLKMRAKNEKTGK